MRNSSCAGVSGFERGAGDEEAAGPDLGTREGSDEGGEGEVGGELMGTVLKTLEVSEEDWYAEDVLDFTGSVSKTFEVSGEDWYAEEVLDSMGTVSKTRCDGAEVRNERLGRALWASFGARKS